MKWGASVARCSPYRWYPLLLPGAARTALLSLVTQSVRTLLRGNRERLVIVGTCVMGRCGGPIPGKSLRFSTHVDPGSAPSARLIRASTRMKRAAERLSSGGGAAGYCPRVRCAYFTPTFIAIAGRAGTKTYRRFYDGFEAGSVNSTSRLRLAPGQRPRSGPACPDRKRRPSRGPPYRRRSSGAG